MLPPVLATILVRLHDQERRSQTEEALYNELLFVEDFLMHAAPRWPAEYFTMDREMNAVFDRRDRARVLTNAARLYMLADGRPIGLGAIGCKKDDCPLKEQA